MPQHLILFLDAPMMSFGGETIDNYGVVRDFPALSMIAGLIGNALGLDRPDGGKLDRLQERLVMGSARLRDGTRIRDFQTAKLEAGDKGWTTRGRVEGRAGGAATYDAPHIRYRDADADALVLVALRLEPAGEEPVLADVEKALNAPERPLFIGRKPFLPSWPLCRGMLEAASIPAALETARNEAETRPHGKTLAARPRAQWPASEGGHNADDPNEAREMDICDERRWVSGVHGGLRSVVEGHLPSSGTGLKAPGDKP